ncbi:hypothetical protein STEG23_010989 [Scotinomys teguina]
MSAVMLLPGTNGSLLLVQRTVTRTFELQESIGKGSNDNSQFDFIRVHTGGEPMSLLGLATENWNDDTSA